MREELSASVEIFLDALEKIEATPHELAWIASQIQIMASSLVCDELISEELKQKGLLN